MQQYNSVGTVEPIEVDTAMPLCTPLKEDERVRRAAANKKIHFDATADIYSYNTY